MCICSLTKPIETDIELIILQHSSEVHQPKGTARILSLSLKNSQILVGEDFSDHTQLNEMLNEAGVNTIVLYPSEQSVPLEQMVAKQVNEQTRPTSNSRWRVLLLDGTWKKAYKMWQLSKNLHALPCVALPEDLKGNYRVRKAPSENSLSTVEAGYHVLSLLDPSTNYQPLLAAFEQMVDRQMAHIPKELRDKY